MTKAGLQRFFYRLVLFTHFTLISSALVAQVSFSDNFEDGNFTANPVWIGQTDSFVVFNDGANNWLRLNAPSVSGTAFLSTESAATSGTWEFSFQMLTGGLSTSNYARFYFMSNASRLTGSLNGYYVAVSQVSQEIGLYRQSGTTTTKLAGGAASALATLPVNVRIRVTRSASGLMEVFADVAGGTAFQSLFSFTDNTFQTSSFIGVRTIYSSTRNTHYFFDNFVWPNAPFRLTGTTLASRTELELTFSKPPQQSTILPGAFSVSGVGNPASVSVNGSVVLLTFSTPLSGGQKTVSVSSDVLDATGNPLEDGFRSRTFLITDEPVAGDIRINELLFDPPTGFSDYIELVNRTTDRFFQLNGMRLADASGSTTISTDFLLEPGMFVVVSPDTSILFTQFGDRNFIRLTTLPNLNGTTADAAVLRTSGGLTLDSLTYQPTWGTAKKSLERKSLSVSSTARANWGASPATIGTPGIANTIQTDGTAPTLKSASLQSKTSLLLVFDEEITSVSAQTLSNYSFTQSVSASAALYLSPDSVRLTLSGVPDEVSFQLTLSGVADIFGNSVVSVVRNFEWIPVSIPSSGQLILNEFMYDPPTGMQDYVEIWNRSTANFDLSAISIADANLTFRPISTSPRVLKANQFAVVLRDSLLLSAFPGIPLATMGSNFPSLNNTGQESIVLKSGSVTIDSVTWNSATWGGAKVALERRSATASAGSRNNWLPSTDPKNGTPGTANTAQPDTTKPFIVSSGIVDAQTIELLVSEDLNPESVSLAQATMSGGITVNIVSIPDVRIVRLQLLQPMVNQTAYTLQLSGVQDIFGNAIRINPQSFTYFTVGSAVPGNVVIHEFMYDTPTGFTEFIELRNVSETAFNLSGWTYNDNSGIRKTITTSAFLLPPGGYVVIAPDSTLERSNPGIRILTMGSNFASLNNSNDQIVIRTGGGLRIDSVAYFSTWGGSQVSLERRSVSVSSNEPDNWGNSVSTTKATPGAANSVTAPTSAPVLMSHTLISADSLLFEFSRSIAYGDNFQVQITPNLPVRSASITARRFILRLSTPLSDQQKVTAQISGLVDVFGNSVATLSREFVFYQYQTPTAADVRITEFMYEPPAGFSEFVELQNVSSKVLNFQNWGFSDNANAFKTISSVQRTFLPGARLVLAQDSSVMKLFPAADVILVSGFPSLNNTIDAIVIRSAERVRLDSVAYSSVWGGAQSSLERRSNAVASNEPDNWASSVAAEKATPGLANSVGPLTVAPILISSSLAGRDSLIFDFNRSVVKGSGFAVQITPEIAVSSSTTSSRRLILRLTMPLSDQQKVTAQISGLVDVFGNSVATLSREFVFYQYQTPTAADVRITEFMYEPPAGFSEFVELQNVSSKVLNLQNWGFSDNANAFKTISSVQRTFLPGARLVLAQDSSVMKLFPAADVILVSGFPSLNNTIDAVVIRSAERIRLDSVGYSSVWGGAQSSLERRSNAVASNEPDNWASSIALEKATPGLANSVGPLSGAPEILNASLIGADSIQVDFNRTILAGSGFSASVSGISGLTVSNRTFSGRRMLLRLSARLTDRDSLTISIRGVTDLFGNVIAETSFKRTFYDYKIATSADIRITEFMFDPPAGLAEFVELENLSSRTINLQTLRFSNKSRTFRTVSAFPAPFLPGSRIVLVADSTLIPQFRSSRFVLIGGFPALTNTSDAIVIKNLSGVTLDSLTYFAHWGGQEISLERRSNSLSAAVSSNWGNSLSPAKATPGLPNTITPDLVKPVILAADLTHSDTLRIRFSEEIRPENIPTTPFILAENGTTSSSQRFLQTDVFFKLNGALPASRTVRFQVRGLSDWFSNMLRDTSITITRPTFVVSQAGDAVINEILYRGNDAFPEFVEIINTSSNVLDLANWTFSDESGTARIRPVIAKSANGLNIPLLPDSMVILTGNAAFAARTRNAVLVSGFPSLGNAGDVLVIRNASGTTIDSLFYRDAWGASITGQTLERRDPKRPSVDPDNWLTGAVGGTPGAVNRSFEPDVTAPQLLFVNQRKGDTLQVRFSEFVTLPNDAFALNGVAIPILNRPTGFSQNWLIQKPTGIIPGSAAEIVVSRVSDARGNSAANLRSPVAWTAASGSLAINEIMHNPLADPRDGLPDQSEYVELMNTTAGAVSLEGIRLQTPRDEQGRIRITNVDGTRSKTLLAGETMVIHADTSAFSNSRIAVYFEKTSEAGFFRSNRTSLGFSSTAGTIIVADSNGVVLDSVAYSAAWHNPNVRDVRGKSLERIDPKRNPNSGFNWSTSTSQKGGTPVQANTLFRSADSPVTENSIEISPNPFSPDNDAFEDQTVITWKFDKTGFMLRVRIFDRYGRTIRNLADHFPAGLEGSMVWDGTGDDRRTARPGIFIVLMEAHDSTGGATKTFKKTVVLAPGR